jgi:hypothetical protein
MRWWWWVETAVYLDEELAGHEVAGGDPTPHDARLEQIALEEDVGQRHLPPLAHPVGDDGVQPASTQHTHDTQHTQQVI